MPGDQDNSNAADAPAAESMPTGPAPGKMRVEQKTLDQFDDGQRSALQQANMERTTRGLPNWVISDYVRVHPDKFKDVDFDLDNAEAKQRAESAGDPGSARLDQRAAR